MDELRVADSITEVFALFRRCNKYIDETTPWVLAKDESKQDRLAEVLYNLTEAITIGASLLHPFLPDTAEKIVAQLNTSLRDLDDLDKFGNFCLLYLIHCTVHFYCLMAPIQTLHIEKT